MKLEFKEEMLIGLAQAIMQTGDELEKFFKDHNYEGEKLSAEDAVKLVLSSDIFSLEDKIEFVELAVKAVSTLAISKFIQAAIKVN